jgi:hypothetical protein
MNTMMRKCDEPAVGYTDMRLFQEWLRNAPGMIQVLATLYPPSVYRLKHPDGTVLRVFPEKYYWDGQGALLMNVVAAPELNMHYPHMAPVRITGVVPSALEPIKWPPDAEVH